jgi:hypothetical protein
MKQYRVTGVKAGFTPGMVLSLTEDQYQPRAHLLKKIGKDQYQVNSRVEFKNGEQIGIVEGSVAKTDLLSLDTAAEEKPLANMSKDELVEAAKMLLSDVDESELKKLKKEELIDLIEAGEDVEEAEDDTPIENMSREALIELAKELDNDLTEKSLSGMQHEELCELVASLQGGEDE